MTFCLFQDNKKFQINIENASQPVYICIPFWRHSSLAQLVRASDC